MSKFKDDLKDAMTLINLPDEIIEARLLDIIYERHKSDTISLFLMIQNKDRQRLNEERSRYHRAANDCMENLSIVSQSVLEEGYRMSKEKAKTMVAGDRSVFYMIDIIKVLFPKGDVLSSSKSGKWFFNQFKRLLIEDRADFEEGGKNRTWARDFGHEAYIDLVLQNVDKNK